MKQTIKFALAGLVAAGLVYLVANSPQTGSALLLTSIAAFVVKEMVLGPAEPSQTTALK